MDSNHPSQIKGLDIAVIGMACRFPGAENHWQFWDNLKQNRSDIGEIPENRWNWKEYWGDPKTENNKCNCRWGGFIQDADAFDPGFFNFSAREAEAMDPQQRIILELAWSCLEDAGIRPSSLAGENIGVFIGVTNLDYKELHERESYPIEGYCATGTAPPMIPNRISHYFNFKGPSFSLDEACSSSLDTIHLGCNSIRLGECGMALAGGVNLILTPRRQISFSKMGILSATGFCKAFDDEADGTLRGEGAGMILLKPLEKALADGDTIYGVVKGSAVNHCGKTPTLTYPNPEAQAEVIINAHKQAGISPDSISYVETHGTGTLKGDPIEFQGLLKAFTGGFNNEGEKPSAPYCGLGSVKPNIGHLESAAGIAGVIKVLLSMYHQQLPGLCNFKRLNQRIVIQDTPFYIVAGCRTWEPIRGKNQEALPRRAGVSSFGAGGTNTHVVLEEAPTLSQPSPKKLPGYLICLSAKTEAALRRRLEDLGRWLDRNRQYNNLYDLSATLLLGRESFEVRAALVVRNIRELREKMAQVFETGHDDQYFHGSNSGKENQEPPDFEQSGKAIAEEFQPGQKINERKYHENLRILAEMYVNGAKLDWKGILFHAKFHRLSLPTYPFARERFWIPQTGGKDIKGPASFIHPLLHQNTSDLAEQRFSSFFTGEEFFLAGHVIQGQRILPGVAYLEMARAAVIQATGTFNEGRTGVRLKQVVWLRPVTVAGRPARVHIGLIPERDHEISFEIYHECKAGDMEPVVYCRGKAELFKITEFPALDLPTLQSRCNQGGLSSTECYEIFRAMGVEYGPAFRGIERIHVGRGEVLAKLSLPPSVSGTIGEFVLHPSMTDSALQAMLGFMTGSGEAVPPEFKPSFKPALAFALQEMEIHGGCAPSMWARVSYSQGSHVTDKVTKFDIELCDDTGTVSARIKGLSSRVAEPERITINPPEAEHGDMNPFTENLMLTPVWDPVLMEQGTASPSFMEQVIIAGGSGDDQEAIRRIFPKAEPLEVESRDTVESLIKRMAPVGNIDHIVWITPWHDWKSPVDDAVITEESGSMLFVFRIVQALTGLGYTAKNLTWTVITNQTQSMYPSDGVNPIHAGLHGLMEWIAKEYPNWKIRCVDLDAGGHRPLAELFSLPPAAGEGPLAYRRREWYRRKLIPVYGAPLDATLYKTGGVYVVIGGAGKIGAAWSEYMIRTYQARLVWIDRKPEDASIRMKLDALARSGAAPRYITADASNRRELEQACREIKETYPQIHGLIQAANALTDGSFTDMDEERFKAGLSANVDASVRIAQVFHGEALDFILFFSSFQRDPNAGRQHSYAPGGTFKNALTRYLAREWSCPVKLINWEIEEQTADGAISSSSEAMKALEILLAGPVDQMTLRKTARPIHQEIS